ncbi:fluoride efflux transporter CrcB (plasmid) [Sphingomonas paeninsulae]|uniref:Fluoride-specific ion channel FluC n=1 Tax=Sphingomonas paeninsulae TaxID=2319844 RepID=A0A494TBQ4_SPHPE|nr:fluoride efflux transporter CrcB [Sphingomonas paeninsulae]AYJ84674.1 fluoride efflux transporter CrcB [Sphingomonas paeninsulae]
MTALWIAAGGALGTLVRYWINLLVTARVGEAMPWGTIGINISGSFIIGFVAALTEEGGRFMLSPELRLFLIVGFCGGYTTFSSFSLQTLALLQSGEPGRAAANVIGSVVLCLAAVWLGYSAPTLFSQRN